MGKPYLEIFGVTFFVFLATFFVYGQLSEIPAFWASQFFWSVVLSVGWVVVALGYYHQGWLVHKSQSSDHVSLALPVTVFFVQCVLFVKGIYYSDWSLIVGAVLVNSGVLFSIYQIVKNKRK